MVRINHEKCSVELRNHRLAEYAADSFGRATGEVYRTLLGLLTTKMSRCRGEPLIGEPVPAPDAAVTTLDILDHLDDSLFLTGGIGRSTRDRIDLSSAERIREKPYDPDAEDSDNSDNDAMASATSVKPTGRIRFSADQDYEDDSDDKEAAGRGYSGRKGQTNGDNHTKVQFEEETTLRDSRLDQMRQHLLLLSESKQQFIRHCGTQGRGQWTVDFGPVIDRLRETELDSIIEHSFGRHGLRLTRILREKGKLDEKMLHSAALMKKPDVQGKMLAMQMAGLVDVQEVPKDSSRMANRTLFFWFFDRDRTRAQLLDDVYKAMLRCLQTLQVERHKERNILLFVERKDVQGKEEEVMTAEHYNKYNRHLEVQEKLLGQLMRLDDIVSVFRDF
jgi:DNA-directed RNA polymerase III subunit RPC3